MTQPRYPNFAPVATDWDIFDVPALWVMVESEQDWANREQVSAWTRMHDLLVSHQENLQRIKRAVADRWPPEGSEASRRFLARLDELIDSAQRGSVAARSNASALDLLTDALLEAKAELRPLHAAWQAATPEQQGELNKQARAVMTTTDQRVVEHGNQFTVPPAMPSTREQTTDGRGATQPPAAFRQMVASSLSGLSGDAAASADDRSMVASGPGTATGSESDVPEAVLAAAVSRQPPRSRPTADRTSASMVDFDEAIRAEPVAGVLGLSVAVDHPPSGPPGYSDSIRGYREESSGYPESNLGAGANPSAVDEPVRTVRPVQSGARPTSLDAGPWAGGEQPAPGLVGDGLHAGSIRAHATLRRQYPAAEEWDVPAGVAPVVRASRPPSARTTFDPGPNVIGGLT